MSTLKNLRACLVLILLGCSLGTTPVALAGNAFDTQKLYRQNILGTVFIRVKDREGGVIGVIGDIHQNVFEKRAGSSLLVLQAHQSRA